MSNRVVVYDAHDIAARMRETFVDRAVERKLPYNWRWPTQLQNVGDSLAVAYASDKWEPKDRSGKRKMELYKHLAESRNRCLAERGVLVDYYEREPWPVIGPTVSFAGGSVAMPNTFALLGLFEELCLQLHTEGDDASPDFGADEDDGVVHVAVRHALLGGSMMRHRDGKLRPFLFVYTKKEGVKFIVVGDQLDIEKDGIVG
jgi:hypothetical protein